MTAFTLDSGALSAAAAWVAKVAPARPVTPILGGMLVDVTEQEVRLTVYDYETAATVTLPIMLGEPGRMLTSSRLLAAVAVAATKTAKASEVTVTDTGTAVAVKVGRSEWKLPVLPIDEYAQLPGDTLPESEVSADDLRRALWRVTPAVDGRGQVPALAGVEISADGDQLTLAATDRFRLATTTIPWKPHADAVPPSVVPGELLEAAAKALAEGGTARIGATGTTFTIATDTHTLTGRTIDAQFPTWRKLIPAGQSDRVAVVESASLARAADQVSVMLDPAQPLRLAFDTDTVEVSAVGDDRSARAHAGIEHYRGEPITVAVNPMYLREALLGADSELVELQFGESATRPILLLPVARAGAEPDDYRHLLMPVKAG
jgi:DNA polymerase-3 subunit beta